MNLDLNKMCLVGAWVADRFAYKPNCEGSSGGMTAISNSNALTVAEASISVAYCEAYARDWIDANPTAHNMCDGCFFGDNGCVGTKAYALAPVDGIAAGSSTEGASISLEDARISVAYCAEQMKNEPDCSPQFIGVSKSNGHCWCAKTGGNCQNYVNFLTDTGHFFQSKLNTRWFIHLLMHSCSRELARRM